MAKRKSKRRTKPPVASADELGDVDVSTDEFDAEASEPAARSGSILVAAEIPLADLHAGAPYVRHLDVQLSRRHWSVLRRVFEATVGCNVLDNGKAVETLPDALRYVLEQIEDGERVDIGA